MLLRQSHCLACTSPRFEARLDSNLKEAEFQLMPAPAFSFILENHVKIRITLQCCLQKW